MLTGIVVASAIVDVSLSKRYAVYILYIQYVQVRHATTKTCNSNKNFNKIMIIIICCEREMK